MHTGETCASLLPVMPVIGHKQATENNMNIQVFIVACITALAFIAHLFSGTRESLSISPLKTGAEGNSHDLDSLNKNWIQSMCAFQMISVDLLILSGLLFVISLTDIVPFERVVILSLSVLYLLWGLAWLIQLLALKAKLKNYLHLGQWMFWLISSGLLCWGS